MQMNDPSLIQTLLWATLLGGGIVVLGAGYAICHALAQIRSSPRFKWASLTCYLGLALSVLALTLVLEFANLWLGLSLALLLGYFFAPRFIWRLSVAVHSDTSTGAPQAATAGQGAGRIPAHLRGPGEKPRKPIAVEGEPHVRSK